MLPLVFILRAINFLLVYFITDPLNQMFLYNTVVSFTHISAYIVMIAVQSFLSKQYPKNIRGMCMMVQSIFTLFGLTFYLQFLNHIYKIEKVYPFLGVSGIDFVIGLVLVIVLKGKNISNQDQYTEMSTAIN